MQPLFLTSRTFDMSDQEAFAHFSGDFNPMHMDPIAARRTLAGRPVVHGVHMLLWALDIIAGYGSISSQIKALTTAFEQFVYVGDTAQVVLARHDEAGFSLEVMVGDRRCVAIMGSTQTFPSKLTFLGCTDAETVECTDPADIKFEDMKGRKGRINFKTSYLAASALFPKASNLFGITRIAALGCTSKLVGMICPGLHSIYNRLQINLEASKHTAEFLDFEVSRVDPRFRRVQMEIAGEGVTGTVYAVSRMAPILQPSLLEVAKYVTRKEFEGVTALIIGGSRGLGELTAKIIAAGGGRVWITFAQGQEDAKRVQEEIQAARGKCEIIPYDVLASAEKQLALLPEKINSLYYFATPHITQPKADVFIPERFHNFLRFYATGFYHLCYALLQRSPEGMSVFYPSSVFVEDRPKGMTEYAMAKAASEVLCRDMTVQFPNLHIMVSRLPRLRTDQTANFISDHTIDALEILPNLIRSVQNPIHKNSFNS